MPRPSVTVIKLLLVGFLAAAACGNDAPGTADGIFADLGDPRPSATPDELATFQRGSKVALRRFAQSDGLGPRFNVTFCASCHEKPVLGGSGGRYRNFLLVGQELSDGSFVATGMNGVQDQYSTSAGREPTAADSNRIATRNPIPFFGVGFLAEITDEEILSRADPEDANGDGISGRPNFDRGFVGRFGRKAQSVAIESFIRGPLNNHLGLTSNPLPPERRERLPVIIDDAAPQARETAAPDLGSIELFQVGAPDEPLFDTDGVPDPEFGENDLFDLVAFSMLLAAPRPDPATPETERGSELFDEVGCAGCHVPAVEGPRGAIPAYTDLLLHDMGPGLADGIIMGQASGSEFRTAPLWGVVAVGPYLHDGRADTLDQAIRAHGGEAEASRIGYEDLAPEDRETVLAFLRSLGGASQYTAGLLPPDAPIPAVGEYGGPIGELSPSEIERFIRGRAVFDRDFSIAGGLGPRFNGDACRACHFDPVIGGSGPRGVNVMRHGIVDEETGAFTPPDIGTMAHRHEVMGNIRPPVDAAANVFEPRQTPTLFGLGLIDRIPEATILALADPDGAEISGRAHVLGNGDGRVGRLGWKANVPSLAEFARDAMFNELGVTLPQQIDLTFGDITDGDGASDPEIALADLEDLVFFMANLGPPPRQSVDPEREARGEQIFADIGCDACHRPKLATSDNIDVPLYSDLLLHDVAPPSRHGIADGIATDREFRTPPLWGLASSGPYMHDGSASTPEQAILAHDSEAHSSRDRFLALPAGERDDLLAFLQSL